MSNLPQPARIVSATVFLVAGLFWVGVSFRPATLVWFSLGEPMWADLSLAGLFVTSGFLFVVRNRSLQYLLNFLAVVCFTSLIAWGVFGIGKP